MMDRRSLMAGLAAAPLLAPGATLAQDPTPLSGIDVTVPRVAPPITPYTIEELFRPAPALDADLSSDGKHVALLIDVDQGGDRETQLLIFSADDPTVGEARFRLGDTNTHWLRWAGSGRVLVGVSGESGENLSNQGSGFRTFHDRRRRLPYQRVLSVPFGSGPTAQLFEPGAGSNLRVPPGKFRKVLNLAEIVAVTDGDHALMAAFDKEDPVLYWRPGAGRIPGEWLRVDGGPPLSTISLHRVNLATGEPELVMEGSDRTIRWEAQGGEPILRRDLDAQGENEIWRTKTPGEANWRPVRTVSRAAPDIAVLATGEEARTFWVLARAPGEARRSIRLWNVDSDTLGTPVSGRPDREPTDTLFDPDGRFLLASYRGPRGLEHDTPDAALKASLATLAVQFGDGAGVHVTHVAPDRSKLLVEVSGPRQPRAYYRFDATRRRLADIGGVARLAPERLADAEGIAVARPGAEPLAGVLTGSLDGKPGPLVVILQSITDRESFYSFDPLAQLFATRGWWTLRTSQAPEPEIDARVAAAVSAGSLDASRTVILGEQQAGEAALAAIGRYRAAVAFNSPSAEDELLAGAEVTTRSELALRAIRGGRPVLVIRNWRDSRSGRTSDNRLTAVMPRSDQRGAPDRMSRDSRGGRPSSSELADSLRRSDTGGLADAVVLGEAGDADWNRLETRIARARAVVDFLDPILK